MISIDLGTIEYFDDSNKQFIEEKGGIVRFEYTLKTLYEWEGKWKKPFLKGDLSEDELIDFYMMMALDPIQPQFLTDEVMETLSKYIGNPNTATKFSSSQDSQNGGKRFGKGKVHTAEELYALMIMANVPLEFETRNLNRLLVILRIISSYNTPPKKMDKQEVLRQNAELNRQRKEQMKTRG